MRKQRRNPHTELVNAAVVALGKRPDLGKFWKQATGAARSFDDPERVITFGLEGAADLSGLIKNGKGTRFEGEAKTGKGKQSEIQKNFEAMIVSYGGRYLVFRSVPQLISYLEDQCKN